MTEAAFPIGFGVRWQNMARAHRPMDVECTFSSTDLPSFAINNTTM
jgi:hypothetical protein